MKENHLALVNEIQEAVTMRLNSISKKEFSQGMDGLKDRTTKYIVSHGDPLTIKNCLYVISVY